MTNLISIFLTTFLAISSGNFLQSRSMFDEAKDQLEQLKSLVRGDIFVAHDELDDLVSKLHNRASQARVTSELTINRYYLYSVKDPLRDMVKLANNAGHDVTSCTENNEEFLDTLPELCKEKIYNCTQAVDMQGIRVAQDARYVVDVTMNKVHNLENQLDRCMDDILCLSPVITEIELYKIRLPQNIQTEVLATENLFSLMAVSIQNCADDNLVDYKMESSIVFKEVEDCINSVLGEE